MPLLPIRSIRIKITKSGIYPLGRIREYTAGYRKAGGRASSADYHTARYDMA